jgi:hypothetical protein
VLGDRVRGGSCQVGSCGYGSCDGGEGSLSLLWGECGGGEDVGEEGAAAFLFGPVDERGGQCGGAGGGEVVSVDRWIQVGRRAA